MNARRIKTTLALLLAAAAIAIPVQSAVAAPYYYDSYDALLTDVLNDGITSDYNVTWLENDLLTSCLYYNICPSSSALASFQSSTFAVGHDWWCALGTSSWYYDPTTGYEEPYC